MPQPSVKPLSSDFALLDIVSTYLSSPEQLVIRRALELARKAHFGKERMSGEAYVEHPIAVTGILASWRAPADVLVTGLLHDVLKDNYASGVTLEMIEQEFGTAVANLVHEVSRLGRLGHVYPARATDERLDSLEYVVERLPWIASALRRDPLAVVVKTADRLHNLQTVHVHVPERQIAFAAGTMNIFVPFAERLGMRAVKRLLEDGAFCILQPDKYQQILNTYPLENRQQAASEIVTDVQRALDVVGIPAQVTSRERSYYNLYLTETAHGSAVPLHLAHPIVVLTETLFDCYRALGAVHQRWLPQPGLFRDYIAAPKPNGYHALHTNVRYRPGEELLIVFRQRQMDLAAEWGLAAQWQGVEEAFLPNFPEWRDPPLGEMNVLTPDGDMFTLPQGATPIDFAYAIHPGLGNQCTGAVVNGVMTSLNQPLESGDVVKILTSSVSVGPSPEWLDIVKTDKAKYAIRRWFKAERPGEMAEKGWTALEAQLRQMGVLLGSPEATNQFELVSRELGFGSRQELLIAIGLGKRNPEAIAERIQASRKAGDAPISLQATIVSLARSDLPQRLAGCCKPIPPDPIVGYVTSQNQVTIHRATCPHVRRLRPLINAEWNRFEAEQQWAEIKMVALDRSGLVRDISDIVTEIGLGMLSFHADRMPDRSAQIQIGLGDISLTQREHLANRLRQIDGVRSVDVVAPSHPSRVAEDSVLARRLMNPYTILPVSGEGFYGRLNELRDLVNNLRDVQPGEAVLLWGPRRIGKTSLLLHFQQHVMRSDDYVVAFIDMQRLSGRSTTMFLRDIVRAIVKSLDDPAEAKVPKLGRMKRDPLGYFRGFLENVPALRDKHLVLIFDEFQLLSELYDEHVTLDDINRYFRSLIQHRHGLSVLFSGGGILENLLNQPSASFMLEMARHQQIGFLAEADARQLIVEPARRVQYDEATVDWLLEITAGHPYYLQWLCGELVARADREARQTINSQHLQDALTDWLPYQGEQFFSHLWGSGIGFDLEAQQGNKLALTAVTSNAIGDRWVSFDKICHSGIEAVLDEAALWRVLQNLVKIGTLNRKGDEHYRIKVALCEQWIRSNHTVEQMIREIQW